MRRRGSTRSPGDYLPAFLDLIPAPYREPGYCRDGFYQAYWRRPHAYLDRFDSGVWHRANEHLLARPTLDAGLRLVIAEIE